MSRRSAEPSRTPGGFTLAETAISMTIVAFVAVTASLVVVKSQRLTVLASQRIEAAIATTPMFAKAYHYSAIRQIVGAQEYYEIFADPAMTEQPLRLEELLHGPPGEDLGANGGVNWTVAWRSYAYDLDWDLLRRTCEPWQDRYADGIWNPAGEPIAVQAWNGSDDLYLDNNRNGTCDPDEAFLDGNGNAVFDAPGRPIADWWVDWNANGVRDANEPFTDTNGNRTFDAPGVRVLDLNGDGTVNGTPFIDRNGDGGWNPGEPFLRDQSDPTAKFGYGERPFVLPDNFVEEDWFDENFDGACSEDEWSKPNPPAAAANQRRGRYDRNGNGVRDGGETFVDANGNGVRDGGELYIDGNSNGVWDARRYVDRNRNGRFDPLGEPFSDSNGDGLWQTGEPYTDLNGNGVFDGAGEPFSDFNGDRRWNAVIEAFWDRDRDGHYDPGEAIQRLPTPDASKATGLSGDVWYDRDGNNRFVDIPGSQEPWLDTDGNGEFSQSGRIHLLDINADPLDWDRNRIAGDLFVDANGNGVRDPCIQEPYVDADGDGHWDAGEPFADADGDGVRSADEPFTDLDGDGRYDAREVLRDLNRNGLREPRQAPAPAGIAHAPTFGSDWGLYRDSYHPYGTTLSNASRPPDIVIGGVVTGTGNWRASDPQFVNVLGGNDTTNDCWRYVPAPPNLNDRWLSVLAGDWNFPLPGSAFLPGSTRPPIGVLGYLFGEDPLAPMEEMPQLTPYFSGALPMYRIFQTAGDEFAMTDTWSPPGRRRTDGRRRIYFMNGASCYRLGRFGGYRSHAFPWDYGGDNAQFGLWSSHWPGASLAAGIRTASTNAKTPVFQGGVQIGEIRARDLTWWYAPFRSHLNFKSLFGNDVTNTSNSTAPMTTALERNALIGAPVVGRFVFFDPADH